MTVPGTFAVHCRPILRPPPQQYAARYSNGLSNGQSGLAPGNPHLGGVKTLPTDGVHGCFVGNGLDRSGDVCRCCMVKIYAAPTPQQYLPVANLNGSNLLRLGSRVHSQNPICREGSRPSLQMGFTGALGNGLDRSGDVCRTLPGKICDPYTAAIFYHSNGNVPEWHINKVRNREPHL